MGLAGIVFTKEPITTFEVEGHKITVRKLTARDSMSLDESINAVSSNKDTSFKTMLASFIDLLSLVIVEVDGIKAESKEDTREFLFGLEQRHITDIFQKSKIFGEVTEESLKKVEGTQS